MKTTLNLILILSNFHIWESRLEFLLHLQSFRLEMPPSYLIRKQVIMYAFAQTRLPYKWTAKWNVFNRNAISAQWRAEFRWSLGWLLDCTPLTNSSIEQWRMVVIVTGYTLFVTSQYNDIFTFAKQHFDEVCWHNMYITLHALSFVMNINYPRSMLGYRSKTQHSTLRQSST